MKAYIKKQDDIDKSSYYNSSRGSKSDPILASMASSSKRVSDGSGVRSSSQHGAGLVGTSGELSPATNLHWSGVVAKLSVQCGSPHF